MSTLEFALLHALAFLVLWALAFGTGRLVLARLEFASRSEELAMASAAGFGAIALAIFTLGLGALLSRPAIVTLLIVLAIASALPIVRFARAGRQTMREWAKRSRRARLGDVLLVVAALAAVAYLLPQPLYPPHLFDELSYHLPFAKSFAQSGSVQPTPHLRFCVFPQLQEMVFTGMLLTIGDVGAHLTQFLAFLLIAIAVFDFARRRHTRGTGVLAAALWLSVPSTVVYASSGYIDVGLTLFSVCAVLAFERFRETRAELWLAASGLMAGFAASSKYTALAIIAVLGLSLTWIAFKERRPALILWFALPGALVAAPWYIRNAWFAGNPFFPLLSGVFGTESACWRPQDYGALAEHYRGYGISRSFMGFFRLPWDLTFHQERFSGATPYSFTLLLLPLVAVHAWWKRKDRVLLVVILAFLALWFIQAPLLRFLMPVMPLYGILLAALVIHALHLVRIRESAPVLGILFLLMFVPTWSFLSRMRPSLGPVPVTDAQRDAFYQRFPPRRCYQWLNEHYGREYVVYSMWGETSTYFADGTRLGDVFGYAAYDTLDASTPQRLFRFLRDRGAGFLMSTDYRLFDAVRRDPWFIEHFELVCGAPQTRLWRLSAAPVRQVEGPELVQNRRFRGDGGIASGWTSSGTPFSAAGTNGIALPAGAILGQPVRATPGALYEIRLRTSDPLPGALAEVSFHWTDAAGGTLAWDRQRLDPNSADRFDYPLTVPERAAGGRIYISNPGTAPFTAIELSVRPLESTGTQKAEQRAGMDVAIPPEVPMRGMERELGDGGEAAFRIVEPVSIVEIPLPPESAAITVEAIELDLRSTVPGAFAVRFLGATGSVSQPLSIDPWEHADDEPTEWVRFLVFVPEEFRGSLERIRLDPPPAESRGTFGVRKVRLRIAG